MYLSSQASCSFDRYSHTYSSLGQNKNSTPCTVLSDSSTFERVVVTTHDDGPLFFPQKRESFCKLIRDAVTFIITGLVIEKGEPTTFSAIEARPFEPEPALDLKASQKAISYLFTIFDAIGSGLIHQLIVRRCIPTRVLIEPAPSS